MKVYSENELRQQFLKLSLPWPTELHIIGTRSMADQPDVFDDYIYLVGPGIFYCFKATTNPGVYWLNNFANAKGSGVVVSNKQYRNLWQLGLHKGKPALVQVAPISVYRDTDRDNKAEETGTIETGYFGINCHCANANVVSVIIGQWSAGCQVIPNPKDHATLLQLCRASGINRFTYTLLKEF